MDNNQVFELLSHLDPELPGFCRDNWQSTVRKFVTAHPKYADMPAWSGLETADIVYDDNKRILTELLADKGYLNWGCWRDKRPRYLIEVKSTTGPVHTPFYVSKRQYRMVSFP